VIGSPVPPLPPLPSRRPSASLAAASEEDSDDAALRSRSTTGAATATAASLAPSARTRASAVEEDGEGQRDECVERMPPPLSTSVPDSAAVSIPSGENTGLQE
jgi:hypothetical protein